MERQSPFWDPSPTSSTPSCPRCARQASRWETRSQPLVTGGRPSELFSGEAYGAHAGRWAAVPLRGLEARSVCHAVVPDTSVHPRWRMSCARGGRPSADPPSCYVGCGLVTCSRCFEVPARMDPGLLRRRFTAAEFPLSNTTRGARRGHTRSDGPRHTLPIAARTTSTSLICGNPRALTTWSHTFRELATGGARL